MVILADASKESPSLDIFKNSISQKESELDREIFYYGDRWPSVHHARIRMGCSKLNDHLFNNYLIDSPSCLCGFHIENPVHYFLHCPNYTALRNEMIHMIAPLSPISIRTLLFGNAELNLNTNKVIIGAVHKFITDSRRFE